MTLKYDYDAVQKAIKAIELDDNIPFGIEREEITLSLTKSEMALMRAISDDPDDLEYHLTILLANGVADLMRSMKDNPDHHFFHIQEHDPAN